MIIFKAQMTDYFKGQLGKKEDIGGATGMVDGAGSLAEASEGVGDEGAGAGDGDEGDE